MLFSNLFIRIWWKLSFYTKKIFNPHVASIDKLKLTESYLFIIICIVTLFFSKELDYKTLLKSDSEWNTISPSTWFVLIFKMFQCRRKIERKKIVVFSFEEKRGKFSVFSFRSEGKKIQFSCENVLRSGLACVNFLAPIIFSDEFSFGKYTRLLHLIKN